jgi:hypothetical protein
VNTRVYLLFRAVPMRSGGLDQLRLVDSLAMHEPVSEATIVQIHVFGSEARTHRTASREKGGSCDANRTK